MGAPVNEVRVRRLDREDIAFLRAMFLETVCWREDGPRLSLEEVLAMPDLAKYLVGWGRPGEERDIFISSRPLEASAFQIENIRVAYIFYESGLSINVMYTVDDPKKRAVGFKLSEGMEVPAELVSQLKFARQKSKLAGTIRGSYFAFENEY
jgi:hypothetical protein